MTYGRFQPLSKQALEKLTIKPIRATGVLTEIFTNEIVDTGLVDKIYSFPYFQGILNGNLNPDKYGSLIVLDSFYCFNAVESLRIAANNSKDATLKELLIALYQSYLEYAQTFPDNWHLGQGTTANSEIFPSVVIPSDIMNEYAKYERKLSEDSDIYALIVMFTCYHLWPLLYGKMTDIPDTNVYKSWIQSNQGGSTAEKVDNYVTNWAENNPDSWSEIVKEVPLVFNDCALYEANLFYEAAPVDVSLKEYLNLK